MAQIVQHITGNPPGGGFVGDEEGGPRRRSKRHKGVSQKRKLEQAQGHLRSKMRDRLNGPAMVGLSSRLRKSSAGAEDGGSEDLRQQGDSAVLRPRVRPFTRTKNGFSQDHKKQLTGKYWRTQQERYSNITHSRGNRTSNPEDVPLHEIVDRVIQRRDISNNISPLTIRKIVARQPITTVRKDKGQYFVVLHHEQPLEHNLERRQDFIHQVKTPHCSPQLEINTWRPELEGTVCKQDSLLDEDRGVINYKLQLRQAARHSETRFVFTNRAKLSTIQKSNTLPPIKVPQVVSRYPTRDKHCEQILDSLSSDRESDLDQEPVKPTTDRTRSGEEILRAVQTYKRARRKPSENDFKTILRTRNRFTAKTKQFKEELSKPRPLSVIDEDQSSVSSGRTNDILSRRPSQSSLRNLSATSLKKIYETTTPEPEGNVPEAKAKQMTVIVDRSTCVIEEDDEDNDDDLAISQTTGIIIENGSDKSIHSKSRDSRKLSLSFAYDSTALPPIKSASTANYERNCDQGHLPKAAMPRVSKTGDQ